MVVASPILNKTNRSLSRKGKPKTEGKVKGADSILKASVKKLQLPEDDGTPVTITKVHKIVQSTVKKLQPKITKKVAAAVKPFDPRKMLAEIFKGGLGQLEKFAKSLASLKKPLGEIFKFINKAKNIFLNLLKKLTKIKLAPKEEEGAKPKKKKKGLIGNILKGAATLGLIALTTWGISKLMKRGEERGETKPGSKVTPIEPVEGTELLDKKEIKKFNKAVKLLQDTLFNFQEQIDKAAKANPEEEDKTEEDKPKTDNEKVQSLAGTTQTALIPGELAPAELNVIVPKTKEEKAALEKSKGDTTGVESSVTKKSKVMQHDADHSTSGGKAGFYGGKEGSGDGSTSTSKTKPIGTENFTNLEIGEGGKLSYSKEEGDDGSTTESYSFESSHWKDTGEWDHLKFHVNGEVIAKGHPKWEKMVEDQFSGKKELSSISKAHIPLNKHLQSKVEAGKKESDLRRDNSLGVSRVAGSEDISQVNESVIQVPTGVNPQATPPKSGLTPVRSPDDSSAGVKVPFLIAVDGSNFALMFSKSQYNIVDAL